MALRSRELRWLGALTRPGAEGPQWKTVSAKRFGIKETMIPDEAWNVLHRLRSRGAFSLAALMAHFV
jgi:hypothetical protein